MNLFFNESHAGRWINAVSVAKRILLFPRSFRLVKAEFSLPCKEQHSPVSLVYVGEGESLPYFFSLLKVSPESDVSPSTWREMHHQVGTLAAGGKILVIETNRLLQSLLPPNGWISYPWIRQRAYLQHSSFRSRRQGIEGNYGRKVRQNQYESRQTQDPAELDCFYQNYYLPHLQTRFGALSHPRGLSEFRAALRSGFLLQVWRKGKWVAGVLCSRRPGSVQALAFGLEWSDQQEWDRGALSAAYYFLFNWAEKNGIPVVDLLRSRANRVDGVFIHKSRWGASPERDPWPHTLLSFYFSPSPTIPFPIRTQLIWRGGKFQTAGDLLECEKNRSDWD